MCLGGRATVDGGTGILRSLGVRFLDCHGNDLEDRPEALLDLKTIDVSGLDAALLNCTLSLLCDVEAPLLGPGGAAAMFASQKGADPAVVDRLERALQRLALVLERTFGRDIRSLEAGGGAGGVAAGLHAALNAKRLGSSIFWQSRILAKAFLSLRLSSLAKGRMTIRR